jgi:hypothetical protein
MDFETDGSGNILWQNVCTGTTSYGQQFNDVVQTSDGGYAAAGHSYQSDHKYADIAAQRSQKAAYWVSGVRKNMRTVQGSLCRD